MRIKPPFVFNARRLIVKLPAINGLLVMGLNKLFFEIDNLKLSLLKIFLSSSTPALLNDTLAINGAKLRSLVIVLANYW